MKRVLGPILIVFALLLGQACNSDRKIVFATDGDGAVEQDGTDADSDSADMEAIADGDAEPEAEKESACPEPNYAGAGKTGAPCTTAEKSKCATSECLDKDNSILKQLGQFVIPGGYCGTTMFCYDESSSAAKKTCTLPEGICLNGGFVGANLGIMNLCLRPCEKLCDCRADEDQVCFDPQTWVVGGKLSAEASATYFKGHKLCMPNELRLYFEKTIDENTP